MPRCATSYYKHTMNPVRNIKILGIDPGTRRVGYGLIKKNGDLRLLDYGVMELAAKNNLLALADKFDNLLKKLRPDLVAIEKLYFAKNRKTALAVAQSRGVLVLKSLENKLDLVEYTPLEIKQAVTSYGFSDKKAVAMMVKKFLNVKELKGYDDASDALAIAITAANRLPRLINTST